MDQHPTPRHGGPRPGSGRPREGDPREIRMDDAMWAALGELAAATGRTRSAVVREAVRRHLLRRRT